MIIGGSVRKPRIYNCKICGDAFESRIWKMTCGAGCYREAIKESLVKYKKRGKK